MKSLAEDPWIQVFGLLFGVSGLFCAYSYLAPQPKLTKAPPPASTVAPPPRSGLPSKPGAGGTPTSPDPGAPRDWAVPLGGQSTRKNARGWVVDAAMSPDSDGPSIQRVVDSAKPGDLILVRRGIYREPLTLRRSVRIVGAADERREVRLEGVPIRVASASVEFENLTLAAPPKSVRARSAANAGELFDGHIKLVKVDVINKDGAGFVLSGKARLLASGTRFFVGTSAVTVKDESHVDLSQSRVSSRDTGVRLFGRGSSGNFTRTTFSNGRVGVTLFPGSLATASSCLFDSLTDAGILAYGDAVFRPKGNTFRSVRKQIRRER